MEKRNILVTGGAGYIGSILVGELLRCGHYVTVVDNFMFKQSSLNNYCVFKDFKVVKKGKYEMNAKIDHGIDKMIVSCCICTCTLYLFLYMF